MNTTSVMPKKIKNSFGKNGLQYRLIERTSDWAIFRLYGESGAFVAVEMCRIYQSKKDYTWPNGTIVAAGSESISGNSQFGIDGSFCLPPRMEEEAARRFKSLQKPNKPKEYEHLLAEVQSPQNTSTELLNVK